MLKTSGWVPELPPPQHHSHPFGHIRAAEGQWSSSVEFGLTILSWQLLCWVPSIGDTEEVCPSPSLGKLVSRRKLQEGM
ncbi:hypothetical protein J0S82_010166, partial [Galemys pyrenaicus]